MVKIKGWCFSAIYLETYRSGHNENDSKSFCLNGHVGSNPTVSVLVYSRCKPIVVFIRTEGLFLYFSFSIIYGMIYVDEMMRGI